MTATLDIAAILSNAGADADAPEGSQAWALAQVAAVVQGFVSAADAYLDYSTLDTRMDLIYARNRIGGQP